MGKPGLAKDLINNPSKLVKQEKEIEYLNEILKAPLSRKMLMVKEFGEDYGSISQMLSVWIWELRKRFINSNQPLVSIKIKKIIEKMEYTKALLDRSNVNPALLMESLMIEIK